MGRAAVAAAALLEWRTRSRPYRARQNCEIRAACASLAGNPS